ncbi:hypothetical protein Dimus_008857, partial [Dionaea muscipula]
SLRFGDGVVRGPRDYITYRLGSDWLRVGLYRGVILSRIGEVLGVSDGWSLEVAHTLISRWSGLFFQFLISFVRFSGFGVGFLCLCVSLSVREPLGVVHGRHRRRLTVRMGLGRWTLMGEDLGGIHVALKWEFSLFSASPGVHMLLKGEVVGGCFGSHAFDTGVKDGCPAVLVNGGDSMLKSSVLLSSVLILLILLTRSISVLLLQLSEMVPRRLARSPLRITTCRISSLSEVLDGLLSSGGWKPVLRKNYGSNTDHEDVYGRVISIFVEDIQDDFSLWGCEEDFSRSVVATFGIHRNPDVMFESFMKMEGGNVTVRRMGSCMCACHGLEDEQPVEDEQTSSARQIRSNGGAFNVVSGCSLGSDDDCGRSFIEDSLFGGGDSRCVGAISRDLGEVEMRGYEMERGADLDCGDTGHARSGGFIMGPDQ